MRQMRVAALLIALALGGCSYLGIGTDSSGPGSATAEGHARAEKPATIAAVPPVPVPPPAGRPPVEQPSQAIDPAKLVGLTQDQTRELIGPPTAVRDEPPAVVWTYGSAGCGLDVFFYLDLGSQTFKALTYEVTPKGPRALQGSACMASLRPPSHD